MKIFILIIALVSEVISIIKEWHKEKKGTWIFGLKVFVAIAVASLAVYEIYESSEQARINAKSGEFSTVKDCNLFKAKLALGGVGFDNVDVPMVLEDDTPWGKFTNEPVNHWCENGQINLDIQVRNSMGNPIAEIYGRSWSILDDASIDYNYDQSGFEIVSGGKVVFQIDLRMNVIIVKGIVASQTGATFYANENGLHPLPPFSTSQLFLIPDGVQANKLFKYPRKKNLGRRETTPQGNQPRVQ